MRKAIALLRTLPVPFFITLKIIFKLRLLIKSCVLHVKRTSHLMETDYEIDGIESPRIKRFFVVLSSTGACSCVLTHLTMAQLTGYMTICPCAPSTSHALVRVPSTRNDSHFPRIRRRYAHELIEY